MVVVRKYERKPQEYDGCGETEQLLSVQGNPRFPLGIQKKAKLRLTK